MKTLTLAEWKETYLYPLAKQDHPKAVATVGQAERLIYEALAVLTLINDADTPEVFRKAYSLLAHYDKRMNAYPYPARL